MLSALQIRNFRAFRELNVPRLARVNLFVGTNNAGKTSALDAVELLASGGDLRVLWRAALRRGEASELTQQISLQYIFHGFELDFENEIRLAARDRWVELKLSPEHGNGDFLAPREIDFINLVIDNEQEGEPHEFFVSASGLLSYKPRVRPKPDPLDAIRFLGNQTSNIGDLGRLWDEIILTPEESSVLEALRIIEPQIERMALTHNPQGAADAFFLKLAGSSTRVPIGCMGDGIRRLLALALHLSRSTGGALLVDEIDTGLHYSVMVKMWRLVIETAKRLDAQVFATTHSLDCINALSELYDQAPGIAGEVLLHRIDHGEPTVMTYDADQLRIAAEQHMEVR